MDLHHKLRRNPNWHPDSCNICGQLGHQAATCCNGTVDFKAIYGGPEHFLRLPTVYPSDVYAIQRRKKVLGLDALDRDVEKWRVRRGGRAGSARGVGRGGEQWQGVLLPQGDQTDAVEAARIDGIF